MNERANGEWRGAKRTTRPYYYLRSGILHEVKPRDFGVDLTEEELEQVKDAVSRCATGVEKQVVLQDFWRGMSDGGRRYNFDERLDKIANEKKMNDRG